MAIGKKTGGKDFQKGHSMPGPGRPVLTPEAKEIKKITTESYIKLVNQFTHMSKDELQEFSKRPEATMLEIWICKIIIKGIELGDPVRMDFFLGRLIGKPKEKIELTGLDGGPLRMTAEESMTDAELKVRIDELLEKAKDDKARALGTSKAHKTRPAKKSSNEPT